MPKQKKMTAAQKQAHKYALKAKEEERIAREQREVVLGVGAKRKVLTYKNLFYFKLALIISLPIVFFLYSPLLILIAVLYASTFFVARHLEKSANRGLRKSLWLQIPRLDSFIALVLVCMVALVMILLISTTVNRPSAFEGQSETQVRRTLSSFGLSGRELTVATDAIVGSGGNMSRGQRYAIQATTMLTGQRVLFQTRNAAAIGFGRRVQMPNRGGAQQGGGSGGGGTMVIRDPDGGEPIRIENVGIGQVPAMNLFTQIMVVTSFIVFAGLLTTGVWITIKMKRSELFPKPVKQLAVLHDNASEEKAVETSTGSIGKNRRCPCGSGARYKNCCLKN